VLLWEIYTYGDNPYPSVPLQSLYKTLCDGYQMPKPDDAVDEVSVTNTSHLYLLILLALLFGLFD